MPVGKLKKRLYYSVSKDTGKIKHKVGDQAYEYDYLEGRLKSVQYMPPETFNGTKIAARFLFIFSDGEQEEVFQAGVGASYIHFILGALEANPAVKGTMKLSPYLRDITYKSTGEVRKGISMSIWVGNEMLRYAEDFYDTLAPIKEVTISGEKQFDKTDRINQVRTIAERVNAKYAIAWNEQENSIHGSTEQVKPENKAEDFIIEDDDDDLPF